MKIEELKGADLAKLTKEQREELIKLKETLTGVVPDEVVSEGIRKLALRYADENSDLSFVDWKNKGQQRYTVIAEEYTKIGGTKFLCEEAYPGTFESKGLYPKEYPPGRSVMDLWYAKSRELEEETFLFDGELMTRYKRKIVSVPQGTLVHKRARATIRMYPATAAYLEVAEEERPSSYLKSQRGVNPGAKTEIHEVSLEQLFKKMGMTDPDKRHRIIYCEEVTEDDPEAKALMEEDLEERNAGIQKAVSEQEEEWRAEAERRTAEAEEQYAKYMEEWEAGAEERKRIIEKAEAKRREQKEKAKAKRQELKEAREKMKEQE